MRRFEKGTHVFRRGDPVDHFYVITRGTVDVLVPASAAAKSNAAAVPPLSTAAADDEIARAKPQLASHPTSALTIPTSSQPPGFGQASGTGPPGSRGGGGGGSSSSGGGERGGSGGGGGGSRQSTKPSDSDVVIATLGPGDFFGETGLLDGRATRSASVRCNSDVEVMAMDKDVFTQVALQVHTSTPARRIHVGGGVACPAGKRRRHAHCLPPRDLH